DLGSPIGAAVSSFTAFAIGAAAPLVPFLLSADHPAPIAAAIAGVGLFAVGAVMSLFSGRNALGGGLRMVVIGALAAGATYGVGALFGASVN
ncbi:MAG: VIT1/CCC1 transporter family protein, partial [Parvularculaceae bacterium]|nr:VIT1/CCC1 transporter family protein [Parvularculaceae bacterium]